jgi:LuxR family transcriptional regulator, maltose regulon positive regulatory protein
MVARPHLTELLDRGAAAKLTLISAPAGFGKTTLLAEWLASSPNTERSVGWLSLDEADGEPGSFWTYLITAIQHAEPRVGGAALAAIREPEPPPIATTLATVLNELASVPHDVVLVLDDYHAVDGPDIQAGMVFLVEHLPPRLHLVIATRADPALPLARLRAQGELVEIRAADLRFTPDAAGMYLNEVMALDLGESDVTALEARTEGWITALQLAAISMQGREDVSGFIASFTGDARYVLDYLVEEVLERQPARIRTFLLETSILDRLSGPLCDAVTTLGGGRAMLDALDRANLFLIPLDDRRQWYRYHHLFADVLRARLLDEQADHVGDLHRRASAWLEEHGERSEAIHHALAGHDFDRAADMIEMEMPELRQARLEGTRRRWLEALPEEVFRTRPVLSIGYVGMLMARGEFHDVEARLRDAERWIDGSAAADPSALTVTDEREFRRLPSEIAMYRAAQARLNNDVDGTVAHARRAFELADEDDHFGRGAAAGFLALAHWSGGNLDAAHQSWQDAQASLLAAGHIVDGVGCARPLAEIRMTQGRLGEAMSTYERGLRLAEESGATALRGTADMHVGMSELDLERNDLDAAADHLMISRALGEDAGLAQNPYRWHVAMALTREAEGDIDSALGLLREAERLYISEYYPVIRPIPAMRARLQAADGRLREATNWVRERGLSVDDDLSFLAEYEHVTLARVLVETTRRTRDDSAGGAVALLERLLAAAESGGRRRSVIEILVLLALAHHAGGNTQAALAPLGRALIAAEPEGYVRTFVAEGSPMAALLEAAVAHGKSPEYARRLLTDGSGRQRRQPLEEPLSDRELEVLRLLGTELDGPGIASELVVALSTVRSHTKSIYAKLGVNSRRAAVRRAEELRLLAHTASR